ncbi:hypothetical protein BKE38_25320 [Pseudoroseomonas deserti]|uniref:DUF924 domain-containing protein n=1 Tax=Teichococcus deserti TaxID=1817963 RepID=A0A1V2GVA0_9PROT|nr:DUF924 family protein [Pseudoroseomonas deserti]ONG46517.1 hypothetical protein BKE38_25320 [Pseudoroseomonas deserti]
MSDAQAILDFWFQDDVTLPRAAWFQRDDAFDDAIRQNFGALVAPARDGALDGWAATPDGALALLILLDQFPRNLFRGSPEAFASDPHAREIARGAVLRDRHDMALHPNQRAFLYLPFEHSEALADQALCVALFEGLRDFPPQRAPGAGIDYAWRHWQVIRRFGRFPHRNAVLGRTNTADEKTYLAQPGAGF